MGTRVTDGFVCGRRWRSLDVGTKGFVRRRGWMSLGEEGLLMLSFGTKLP